MIIVASLIRKKMNGEVLCENIFRPTRAVYHQIPCWASTNNGE